MTKDITGTMSAVGPHARGNLACPCGLCADIVQHNATQQCNNASNILYTVDLVKQNKCQTIEFYSYAKVVLRQ